MAEFFSVLPPDEARALILSHTRPLNDSEQISTADSLERVTVRDLLAPQALPYFRRSTMDGYALRAIDTHGASEQLAAYLKVVGEVPMGAVVGLSLGSGQAAIVHTGGMIPDEADAVVPVENTQIADAGPSGRMPFEIEVLRTVAAGQNVIQVGEDITAGEVLLHAGSVLRPQDIGALLALGITSIEVVRRPRVSILATGDELVPPHVEPGQGQIRDINSYTLAALCRKAGAIPELKGIAVDDRADMQMRAADALAAGDMLVVSAGSSVSVRDLTVEIIDELGEPGVLLHGVATRPGKPTILGAVDGKPVLGLPGNPVSAMVQFDMFGIPLIQKLQGLSGRPPSRSITVRLSRNVPSESGREDYVPAVLEEANGELVATPIFGKSNLIFTLVRSDGLIRVPLNRGGLLGGELVELTLF